MVYRAPDSYDVLRRFAPGTPLRVAVELIHAQGTGALIVIGSGSLLDSICSGGFFLEETVFTAQRLAELSKMDGGIVVDDERGLITRANVHFIPDPDIQTSETGTRFRTAERMALQTGFDVLAVSEESWRTAVVYRNGRRYELARPSDLLEGVDELAENVFADYRKRKGKKSVFSRLSVIPTEELHDLASLAGTLGFPDIEEGMEPRGIRALARVPRLPDAVRQSLVSHFRGFQRMLHASVADLEKVEGVGRTRAHQLRRFFDRMIELGDV